MTKLVGNYGEVFERTVGQGSPLKIARGLNALWSNMTARPITTGVYYGNTIKLLCMIAVTGHWLAP